jgi:chromosome segregation ATPase
MPNVDNKKCGPTHHNACDCREAMFAEKIADLERQIESLHVALDWSQDRVKDLENTIAQMQDGEDKVYACRMKNGKEVQDRIEKLEAVRQAAEHIADWGIDKEKNDGSWTNVGWKNLQQALKEANNE